MPLIVALVAFVLIAGTAAWVWSISWLIRSGAHDVARARRLKAGTDPVQLATEQSLAAARRSYLLALDALEETVDAWRDVQRTLGIGTGLGQDFGAIAARAEADPRLPGLLELAAATSVDNRAGQPATVGGLVDETLRMDDLTVKIRAALHRAAGSPD